MFGTSLSREWKGAVRSERALKLIDWHFMEPTRPCSQQDGWRADDSGDAECHLLEIRGLGYRAASLQIDEAIR